MITINLQWLAYPCFGVAIWRLLHGIYMVAMTWGEPDILPLIGAAWAITDGIIVAFATLLGYLFLRAFRQPDRKDGQ